MILENEKSKPAASRLFRTSSERPMAMLRSCPAYAPTALIRHPELAAINGLAELFIKDESARMRLGSFKALGGAYAVAQMISDAAGTPDLDSSTARDMARTMTFITASAGNHGLSVAAGGRIFGARAVIFLSDAVPEEFANRIRSMGADVVRVNGSYEDSVAEAIAAADANGWLLLADGSWPGYIERPALVMEGYTVLAEECRKEFEQSGLWPSHVFLQAGVGGLAAAVSGHIREYWAEQPQIIVVEPDAAPCLQESIRAGEMTRAEGELSNMGRLDCKDASLIAYEALSADADIFVTISDAAASAAVDLLAGHDINTTPSGAASYAALREVNPGSDSRCLLIVTEGPEEG
jgi:diaminopropionate ammonia-lyase